MSFLKKFTKEIDGLKGKYLGDEAKKDGAPKGLLSIHRTVNYDDLKTNDLRGTAPVADPQTGAPLPAATTQDKGKEDAAKKGGLGGAVAGLGGFGGIMKHAKSTYCYLSQQCLKTLLSQYSSCSRLSKEGERQKQIGWGSRRGRRGGGGSR